MALLTVPGGEVRTMVSPQATTACCTQRARRRGNTPRGDSATAGYTGPPAGQKTLVLRSAVQTTKSMVPGSNLGSEWGFCDEQLHLLT
jgi:hypothetical protein